MKRIIKKFTEKICSKLKNQSGTILAESLVAVSLLSISAVIMGTLIVSSVNVTLLSKEYLTAHNLANEGIEAVKAIRNTNKLKDPGNEACWLRLDPTISCDSAQLATSDSNFLPIEEGGVWKLVSPPGQTGDLNIEDQLAVGMDGYSIYLLDIDYAKFVNSEDGEAGFPVESEFEKTAYYRSLKFVEVSPLNDYAIIESKVQWFSGVKPREVALYFILYNN